MEYKESRLLPNFKNSLDINLKNFREIQKVKTINELYNVFLKVYLSQLNDSLYSFDKKRNPEKYVLKQQQLMNEYNLVSRFANNINESELLDGNFFNSFREKKMENHFKSVRELQELLKNAKTEYDIKDITLKINQGKELIDKTKRNLFSTQNTCPFHHKFVQEKLDDYFRMKYFENSTKVCSAFIDNERNYKYFLIKEYLKQQSQGLSAPLPLESMPDPTTYEPAPVSATETSSKTELEKLSNRTNIQNETEPLPEINLPSKNIFNRCIIREKIKVKFSNIGKNMDSYFVKYAKDKIEGRCRNEGYIRKHSCKVITHTSGLVLGTEVIYNVVYLCEVCVPYHNMVVECYVKNITKLGIRAVLTEEDTPMVIYISKEHHKFDLDNYSINEGDKLTVNIVGYHFEKNDEYISVFGLLNEMDIPQKGLLSEVD